MLNAVDDYAHLIGGKWTTDSKLNKLVKELIHNYKIKENDLQGLIETREIYHFCWR
jgi:DNA-directed RNA polymerase subunit beta